MNESKEELINTIMQDITGLCRLNGEAKAEFRKRLSKRLVTKDDKLDDLALYHAIDHFVQLMDEDGEVADDEDTLKAWREQGDCTLPEGFQRATEYEYMDDETIIEEVMTAYSVNQYMIREARRILRS